MTDPTLSEIMEREAALRKRAKKLNSWQANYDAACYCGQNWPALATEIERQAKEIERLREVAERVDYFGEALMQGQYDPGSPTVRELVELARAALNEKEPDADA